MQVFGFSGPLRKFVMYTRNWYTFEKCGPREIHRDSFLKHKGVRPEGKLGGRQDTTDGVQNRLP